MQVEEVSGQDSKRDKSLKCEYENISIIITEKIIIRIKSESENIRIEREKIIKTWLLKNESKKIRIVIKKEKYLEFKNNIKLSIFEEKRSLKRDYVKWIWKYQHSYH